MARAEAPETDTALRVVLDVRRAGLTQRLANWAEADGSGECFDSSSLFTLADGSKRSPPSDRPADLESKMEAYIAQRVELG